jgi:hypothetical protein
MRPIFQRCLPAFWADASNTDGAQLNPERKTPWENDTIIRSGG